MAGLSVCLLMPICVRRTPVPVAAKSVADVCLCPPTRFIASSACHMSPSHFFRFIFCFNQPRFSFCFARYVSGGELFQYIVRHGKLSEDDARSFFQQIIRSGHLRLEALRGWSLCFECVVFHDFAAHHCSSA